MYQSDSGVLVIALDLPDSFSPRGFFFENAENIPPNSVALKVS